MKKLIVISAPSGTGKTTIIKYLLENIPEISFSVSACSRSKRKGEKDGIDYHFLKLEDFKNKIDKGAFVEWEEVYKNQFYGTLKVELERIWNEGKTVIFDIDVIGALNIKRQFNNSCLSVFIMPPTINDLRKRLLIRGSESEKKIEIRLNKAIQEISKNQDFDKVILNDDLEIACNETQDLINNFINS